VVRPASEAVYVAAEEKERSRITSDNCTETTSLNSVIYSLIGIHRNVGEEKWQHHEEIEGFLLTFRFFLLHKEGIALYKAGLSSPEQLELFKLTELSESWCETVRQACQSIIDFLATEPRMYADTSISRWTILETFLYGDFGHAEAAKRKVLKQWQDVPELFEQLQLDFSGILMFMLQQIMVVAEASKNELGLGSKEAE